MTTNVLPVLTQPHERLLCQLLGDTTVSDEQGQPSHDAGVLGAEHFLDLGRYTHRTSSPVSTHS